MNNPTKQEAQKILRTLPFEKWCDASLMFPPKTIAPRKLKSLYDLAHLFSSVASALVFIDVEKILQWIEKDVGDKELSKLIQDEIFQEKNYNIKLEKIKKLVCFRVEMLHAKMES